MVYLSRHHAQVETRRMGILSNASGADGVALTATEDARLILVAGKPLNEPIVQYGPFVMNTQQEIHQALDDFGSGRFAKHSLRLCLASTETLFS